MLPILDFNTFVYFGLVHSDASCLAEAANQSGESNSAPWCTPLVSVAAFQYMRVSVRLSHCHALHDLLRQHHKGIKIYFEYSRRFYHKEQLLLLLLLRRGPEEDAALREISSGSNKTKTL